MIAFYLLAFFCLMAFEITAIAQTVKPSARYFVFQLLDKPEWYHITADFAQSAFITLFGLISSTIFHLNQSLTLVMPPIFKNTEAKAMKKICIYNSVIAVIVILYLAILVGIFLAPDIKVEIVLLLDLIFRSTLLTIYICTVRQLFRTLKHFSSEQMSFEITSVKRQFYAFLIGFLFQAFYSSFQIVEPTTSFVFECINIVVNILSFDVPIMVVLFAHYQTFKDFNQMQTALRNSPNNTSQQLMTSSMISDPGRLIIL